MERNFYLAFANAPGIGPIKFNKLIKTFGSAKKAWNSPASELEVVLKPALTKKFEIFRKQFEIDKYLEKLDKQRISFVSLVDRQYPQLLRQISNPPIVLFTKGNAKLLNSKCIAVVGTRHVTSYGRQITQMFGSRLSQSGLTIVSGMAFGVDGVAHKACLDSDGKTIAVLGNGVDLPYPRENENLYEEILDRGSLIISEFPPGEPPSVGSFPSRNRIVAGLSVGVLVTEGASDSGSLITANFGLDFGRKVFAIPGPITSQLSAAPLRLIEKGAKLVVSPEDVIHELGVKNYELRSEKKKFDGLSKDELAILGLIQNEALGFDQIAKELKFETSRLGSVLSMMEIKGIVRNSGGKYSVIEI